MNKRLSFLAPMAGALVLLATPAPAEANDAVRETSAAPSATYSVHKVQYRECSQRVGPFVTQSTAWQRLNQAKGLGYATSGVFPCYSYGSRGYCFNVFYAC